MNDAAHKTRKEVEALLGTKVAGARFARVHRSAGPTVTSLPEGWFVENLSFETSSGEVALAWFIRPESDANQVAAVLYCHAHGNKYAVGRDELFDGRPSLQEPYGPALAQLGYAVLCLEMPCFGARQSPSESARSKAHLWHGTTLFGQMLAELSAAVTFLAAQAVVDAQRIAILGFSMGSTHAFWLAALDDRIKAAVALCSFADLATLVASGAHDGHGAYMTVPGLVPRYSTGQIAGLAAPRPLFFGIGLQDWSTPQGAFETGRADLEAAYAQAPSALRFHVEPESGHQETPAMRAAALSFLEEAL